MNRKSLLLAACLLVWAAVSKPAQAQVQENQHKVYSVFIYNFTKYVQWSEGGTGDFVIGVVGNTPLLGELQAMMESLKMNGRRIVVKKLGKADDAAACQLVVLASGENNRLPELLAATKSRQVLIVSESASLAQKGACISFRQEGGRVKLEMNKSVIESKGMRISADLIKYASIVG